MIPGLSIFFMVITLLISFGLPVAIFIIWRKKYDLKIMPLALGISAFIVFALVLQQIVHAIVLSPNADGSGGLLANDPAIFVFYAILSAGVFEETGRFIAFHILKKKSEGIGTGLSYGIGHGGIEAVLLVGLTMLNNLIMSIMVNSGNIEALGTEPEILASVNLLASISPSLFLTAGIERVIAISIHISLSMIVWCSVKVKGKLWLYPAAIVMHAIVNIAPAMYQAGFIDSIWVVEGFVLIPAVLIAYAAYMVCKVIKKEETIEVI